MSHGQGCRANQHDKRGLTAGQLRILLGNADDKTPVSVQSDGMECAAVGIAFLHREGGRVVIYGVRW